MSFRPEPGTADAARPLAASTQGPSTGLLVVNLGTPDAPTAPALRRYLAQFLGDPRVVEIPGWLWKPILYGVILVVRPAQSAAKYASIWMPDGSPLAVWTQTQSKLLRGYLGERGHAVAVKYAMRYGSPSIADGLTALRAEGATRILVLPMYPQYASATTGSVIDDVARWALQARHVPELRFVNRYHDDPGYIAALAASVREHWQREGRAGMLVMSFHGIPERSRLLGDPYPDECLTTGRLLAQALDLSEADHRVTFQSRFGKAKWLQPYTEPTLIELAGQGLERADLICPGFAADCLETLEEISQEARDAFLAAGGRAFHYIPCLNDRPDGMAAITQVAIRHLCGWPTQMPPETPKR
jgi:protoporphyrin/coproporphyrin ferrochelatase